MKINMSGHAALWISDYIEGFANKSNLRQWGDYAKGNSVDQGPIKAQSRRDLSGEGALKDFKSGSDQGPSRMRTSEGKGWYHPSEVSKRNSFTGPKGTKS